MRGASGDITNGHGNTRIINGTATTHESSGMPTHMPTATVHNSLGLASATQPPRVVAALASTEIRRTLCMRSHRERRRAQHHEYLDIEHDTEVRTVYVGIRGHPKQVGMVVGDEDVF